MATRTLLVLLLALLTACSRGNEFVGTWRTKEGDDVVTMILLKDGTGHFAMDFAARTGRFATGAESRSAPIKRWWLDGKTFHYVNAKDIEQTWRVIAVEPNVLTVEEIAGSSSRISVYQRVR
jgi:hypothetical protein